MAAAVPQQTGDRRASERGQMLIIAAGAMVVLLGFMGLVVDIGWSMFQKRVTQNAADAGALAGARAIATIGTCTQGGLAGAVDGAIAEFVADNAGNDATYSWDLRDNQGNVVGGNNWCTQATTVQVQVTNGYSTFFLAILGLSSGSTTAMAQARVGLLGGSPDYMPIVGCGTSLILDSGGGVVDILNHATTPPTIDPIYIGQTFYLHGPRVAQDGGDCGAGGGGFKGVTEPTFPGCAQIPCDWEYKTGDTAGPTRVKIAGSLPGCDLTTDNLDDIDDCVLIVPLGDGLGSTSSTFNVVTYAAFVIDRPANNVHTGVLLGTAFVSGAAVNWTPNSTGLLVLSLVR